MTFDFLVPNQIGCFTCASLFSPQLISMQTFAFVDSDAVAIVVRCVVKE
jgi:hypothetical protein